MSEQTQPQKEELTVEDAEDYRSGKDQGFSHQTLVMHALKFCFECGAREMRTGWFNEKIDANGSVTRTYIDDTRLKFIESVNSALSIMHCDIDPKAKKRITFLKKKIVEKQQELLKKQNIWARNEAIARPGTIRSLNMPKERLSREHEWWQSFVDYQVTICRHILDALSDLSKRLGFYESAGFQN